MCYFSQTILSPNLFNLFFTAPLSKHLETHLRIPCPETYHVITRGNLCHFCNFFFFYTGGHLCWGRACISLKGQFRRPGSGVSWMTFCTWGSFKRGKQFLLFSCSSLWRQGLIFPFLMTPKYCTAQGLFHRPGHVRVCDVSPCTTVAWSRKNEITCAFTNSGRA